MSNTFMLKYLPTWVYASVVKQKDTDRRTVLLKLIDLMENTIIDRSEFEFRDGIVAIHHIDSEILTIYEYVLTGNKDPYTGEKYRHGIMGIGSDIFIPTSLDDRRCIFTHNYYTSSGVCTCDIMEAYLISVDRDESDNIAIFKIVHPIN